MKKVAILGAGISGLSAGYFLNNAGIEFKIFEKQETYGGLARSFVWHGHYCDFAAHRFFTTSNEVESILLDLVPMVHYTRKSHLYIKGNWVNDPINPIELLQFIRQSLRGLCLRDIKEVSNNNGFSSILKLLLIE